MEDEVLKDVNIHERHLLQGLTYGMDIESEKQMEKIIWERQLFCLHFSLCLKLITINLQGIPKTLSRASSSSLMFQPLTYLSMVNSYAFWLEVIFAKNS